MESEEIVLERGDTLLRIVYTILFAIVNRVLGGVVALIVVFELGYALVTQLPPPERVREMANRLVAYMYRIQRYITHNEPEIPFPFADFPDAVEPSRWPYEESTAEVEPTVS